MGRQARIKAARRKLRQEGKLTDYDLKQIRHQQEYEEYLAERASLLQQYYRAMQVNEANNVEAEDNDRQETTQT